MKIYFIATKLFFMSFVSLFGQGPISGFMAGRGHTDFALNYSFESYNFYFFGEEKRDRRNETKSVNLFIEHGFSDTFGLVVTLPYIWIDDINRGLQDGSLFVKYRNQKKRYAHGSLSFITALGISFPISSYPKDTENPIGERATLFQGRFLGQFNFDSGLFIHAQSGLNFRLFPDAQTSIPILLRMGFGGKNIFAEAWMEFFNTLNAGVDTQVFGGSGSTWTKIGGTLYYSLKPNFGLFLSGSQFLSGKNIGIASRVNAGAVYKLSRNR